jgi:retron-type reverse transcriptase
LIINVYGLSIIVHLGAPYNANITKITAKEISKPLTHIFNLSFSSGIIPDNLKVALVTPIFKGNEENRFENYRPISVLTCFSKLLEKLMVKRLINFIDKNKILSKHQYGFRRNRSTELAVLDFVDKITKAIEEGKFTVGIFLDLSKAFDTINHKILIRKLEHYGIRGTAKKLFENYLYNRKQYVKYNGVLCEEMTITSGVPQGSVLGPVLFLLYINDIQFCSKLVSIILFADDTNILYSDVCLKTLNETIQVEMNKITDWLNVNKLSINTARTKLILFRSKNKKP